MKQIRKKSKVKQSKTFAKQNAKVQNTKQKKLFVFADEELFLKSAYNYQSHVVIYIANQILIYNRAN